MKSIIHIGLHKTGTTSLQNFLALQRDALRRCGFSFYDGMHLNSNHIELAAASIRIDRALNFKNQFDREINLDYRYVVEEKINNYRNNIKGLIPIYSSESISYLTHCDEIYRLRVLVGSGAKIIVYLRNKADYLFSHQQQLRKSGYVDIKDKNHHAYTGSDTWLIDYDRRINSFRNVFGNDNVIVVDYDLEVKINSSIIPSFVSLLELPSSIIQMAHKAKWLNKTFIL